MKRLEPYELTFIAEALGKRTPPPLRYLSALAGHASPLVREGAVYGLAPHASNYYVMGMLCWIAATDPNPMVRDAASEALEP